MRECAFCLQPAKLSREHIISDWVNGLFNAGWEGKYTDRHGEVNLWNSKELDWQARVVCETCNNTWMSDLENLYAKPALTPLIMGDINIPIRPSTAQALARFAFKTAVVLDYSQRGREHGSFFSRRLRDAFRRSFEIPSVVQMWMAVYAPGARRVDTKVGYYRGDFIPPYPIETYICTCGIGHFAFQVVAIKQMRLRQFDPLPGFANLAIPLWPQSNPDFLWPGQPPKVLRSVDQFLQFHHRWDRVTPSL